jgi:predicted GIY-YIG superfamily endonuclease
MLAYRIRCDHSSKVYIGVTKRQLKARWSDHLGLTKDWVGFYKSKEPEQ